MKTQKELKTEYLKEMGRVWGDAKMAKYCAKKASRIIETENGKFIAIEKPKIITSFCFGYSDSAYNTADRDRANTMAEYAEKSKEYFLNKNLEEMQEKLEALTSGKYKIYMMVEYSRSPIDTKIYNWGVTDKSRNLNDYNRDDVQELSSTDISQLVNAYKIEIEAFKKKLQSYLKRYGLSKIKAWSYWQDE